MFLNEVLHEKYSTLEYYLVARQSFNEIIKFQLRSFLSISLALNILNQSNRSNELVIDEVIVTAEKRVGYKMYLKLLLH